MRSLVRLALLTGLVMAVPSAADAHTSDASVPTTNDEPAVQRVLLKMKIKRGKKTLVHPGHMTETGSEIILVLTEGKREHEVSVYLEKDGKGFKAEVKYKDGGKMVLEQTTTLQDKKWGELSKGSAKVQLRVDSSAKRPDEVDLPDGDDPLDGLK
jgi:hypothetical protein